VKWSAHLSLHPLLEREEREERERGDPNFSKKATTQLPERTNHIIAASHDISSSPNISLLS
jgi:hypothetical protein